MPGKEIHRFGLDRIKRIEVLTSKFNYPKDFSPLDYYIDYYGVFHDAKPITIRLKAYREKPNYLRSLPLHHSQREIESNADYTIFEYDSPNLRFYSEILSHVESIGSAFARHLPSANQGHYSGNARFL